MTKNITKGLGWLVMCSLVILVPCLAIGVLLFLAAVLGSGNDAGQGGQK